MKRQLYSACYIFLFSITTVLASYPCCFSYADAPNDLLLADFTDISGENLPDEWFQILPGDQKAYTNYLIGQNDGGTFLSIRSGGTGSWIEKELGQIDVMDFPIMAWTWQLVDLPTVEWEQEKGQNDFAIRIELVYDYPGSRWNPLNIVRKGLFRSILRGYPPELVIGYVWAARVPAGKPYVNPSDKRMVIIPIESGGSVRNVWIDEQRDIAADLSDVLAQRKIKRLVLKSIRIRSDSDDTLSKGESGLKSIRLATKEE